MELQQIIIMKFSDLQAKLAALREQSQNKPKPTLRTLSTTQSEAAVETNSTSIIPVIPTNSVSSAGTDRHGNSITYNSRQQEAIILIVTGKQIGRASCRERVLRLV